MLLIILLYFLYYIQTLHQKGNLIPEPYPGELNQLFQTAINPQPPPPYTHTHTLHEMTSRAIVCSSDTTAAYPHITSNLQQTKLCIYNLRFTTPINTNNTQNYQSTTLKKLTTQKGTLRLLRTKDHNY